MNRFVFLFAFLLAAPAFAADIDINMSRCASIGYDYDGADAGACPCDIQTPLVGANVDEDSSEGSVVLSGDSCTGTVYAHVDLASDPALNEDSDHATIVAGTGAVETQNKAATAGAITFNGVDTFVGLSASTEYRACFAFVPNAGNFQNRPIQDVECAATFFTLAAPGAGIAGHFLADNDAGDTDETPTGSSGTQTSGCTTMPLSCSDVSHLGTVPLGGDVWFAEGGVHNDMTFEITNSGTSSDVSEWGCYYDLGDDDGPPSECDTLK